MSKKRKIKDAILDGLTYLSSFIAVLMLALVILFVLSKGLPGLNLRLLTNDYWNKNFATEYPQPRAIHRVVLSLTATIDPRMVGMRIAIARQVLGGMFVPADHKIIEEISLRGTSSHARSGSVER